MWNQCLLLAVSGSLSLATYGLNPTAIAQRASRSAHTIHQAIIPFRTLLHSYYTLCSVLCSHCFVHTTIHPSYMAAAPHYVYYVTLYRLWSIDGECTFLVSLIYMAWPTYDLSLYNWRSSGFFSLCSSICLVSHYYILAPATQWLPRHHDLYIGDVLI